MKKVSWRGQHISLPEEHSLQIALTLRPNNTLKAPLSWTRSLSNMYKGNVHFWSFGAGCRARCSSSEEVGAQTDLCNLYCVWNMNSVHMSTIANPLWQNFYNYDESRVHRLVGALVFSGAGWSAWSTNSPMLSFSPLQSWWLFNELLLCLFQPAAQHFRNRSEETKQNSALSSLHTGSSYSHRHKTISHTLQISQCTSTSWFQDSLLAQVGALTHSLQLRRFQEITGQRCIWECKFLYLSAPW